MNGHPRCASGNARAEGTLADLKPFCALTSQPGQPPMAIAVWHVAHAKDFQHNAAHAPADQVTVSLARVAARHDGHAQHIGVQLESRPVRAISLCTALASVPQR